MILKNWKRQIEYENENSKQPKLIIKRARFVQIKANVEQVTKQVLKINIDSFYIRRRFRTVVFLSRSRRLFLIIARKL